VISPEGAGWVGGRVGGFDGLDSIGDMLLEGFDPCTHTDPHWILRER
jgi:hypothetical protein